MASGLNKKKGGDKKLATLFNCALNLNQNIKRIPSLACLARVIPRRL